MLTTSPYFARTTHFDLRVVDFVFPNKSVSSSLSVITSLQAPRIIHLAIPEERHYRVIVQKLDISDHSHTSSKPAISAGPLGQHVSPYAEWISRLKRLDRGVHCVCHVAMYAIDSVFVLSSTETACNRLVIGEVLPCPRMNASNREVVHRPLACRTDSFRRDLRECFQSNINDPL